jgi:erythromycin esterase-like protein
MELPYDTGAALDDWIQGGDGDVRALLRSSYWWVDSAEILALVEWMRSWNAASPEAPVHLVGFDLQRPGRSAAALGPLLAELDPARLAEVAPILAAVEAGSTARADAEAATTALTELDAALAGRAESAAVRARDHLAVVLQSLDVLRWCDAPTGGCATIKRDVFMAANARRLLDRDGAKGLVWAHNGHVAHAVHADGWHPMGELLRQEATDPADVASILLEFDRGGFVAPAGGAGQEGPARALAHLGGREVAVYRLGPAPPETLASVFASVGRPLWFLDLGMASDPAIADFFRTHRAVQEYGALPPTEARSVSDAVAVPDGWDAVVFVAELAPYSFLD